MKTLDITDARKPLCDYAEMLGEEALILTSGGNPLAAMVSLKNVDWETVSLSSSPEFMDIVEQSRRECKAGQKLSLAEMEQEVASMGSDT